VSTHRLSGGQEKACLEPPNNEMQQTRSAMAAVPRPSLLISVLCGPRVRISDGV